MNDFLVKLGDILEEDAVRPEDVLADFEEWDSLSVLSVLAMIDADYDVTLEPEALADLETVADLVALVESGRERET